MRAGMNKGATAIVAGLLLSGNVAFAQDAAPIAFNCVSGETLSVAVRTDGGAAQVQYGDKSPVRVLARPAKEGTRFGNERHELRIVGNEASWKVGGRSAVKCSTTDTARLAELKR
jgi:hypothetical protein